MRIRFEFSKNKDARYISHLDMIRVFERSVRRAGLPLAYSQGFNPHPKLAFGPALALGTESEREYVDISFGEELEAATVLAAMEGKLPSGVSLLRGAIVPEGAAALNALINRARYTVKSPLGREVLQGELEALCSALMEKDSIIIKKRTKKGIRERDIRKGIFELRTELEGNGVSIFSELLLGPEGSVRPEDVVEVLVSLGMPVTGDYREVKRTGLYSCQGNSCRDPLQVLS